MSTLPTSLQSNGDASLVFGQNQTAFNANSQNYTGSPRPKYLFMVRFVLTNSAGSSAGNTALTYAVRSFDRPKVTPVVQELNQYNKKRLIQTGAKYSPVKISFYDTIDSAAQMMWYQYANFYYGDFRQTSTANWLYDITAPAFQGGENGFGFSPNLSSDAVSAITSSAYFFDHIECYQFYAGEYLQFDLVNPKIVSFNPDSFDAEHSDFNTIDMELEYESIIYHNQNVPASISSNQVLSSWFGLLNPAFDPFTVPGYTPGAGAPGNGLSASSSNLLTGLLGLGATLLAPGGTSLLASQSKTVATGLLGSLGTAVFGQNNPVAGAFGNSLPGIMNGTFSASNFSSSLVQNIARNPSSLFGSSTPSNNQIPQSTYNQSLGSMGSFVNPSAPSSTTQGLAAITSASAITTGSPVSSTFSGSTSSGLSLSSNALGMLNSNSPSSMQVGVFTMPASSSDSFDYGSLI